MSGSFTGDYAAVNPDLVAARLALLAPNAGVALGAIVREFTATSLHKDNKNTEDLRRLELAARCLDDNKFFDGFCMALRVYPGATFHLVACIGALRPPAYDKQLIRDIQYRFFDVVASHLDVRERIYARRLAGYAGLHPPRSLCTEMWRKVMIDGPFRRELVDELIQFQWAPPVDEAQLMLGYPPLDVGVHAEDQASYQRALLYLQATANPRRAEPERARRPGL
jgi:hypothetical protein